MGQRIGELEHQLDFSVIVHNRQGQIDHHPEPDTVLQAGDQICVFASLDALNQLGRLNKGGR